MRRFRNHHDVAVTFPTHGLTLEPGEVGEVDMPADQPVPEHLTEEFGEVPAAAVTPAPDFYNPPPEPEE